MAQAILIYPRIGIVKYATTLPHVDKLRCQFGQYMRIMHAGTGEYGLKMDQRIFWQNGFEIR